MMKSETNCPLRVYSLIALLAFACSSKNMLAQTNSDVLY